MEELNVFLFISNILVLLLCSALLPVLPLLTRPSFLFGVRVPAEVQKTEDARELKRTYVKKTILGSLFLLALCVLQFLLFPRATILGTLFFPFLLTPIQLAAYLPIHKKALERKKERHWRVPSVSFADTKSLFSRGRLSAMPQGWYLFSLLLLVAFFILFVWKYPALPERLPTHWNIHMEPDAWSDKGIWTVFGSLFMGLGLLLMMWGIGVFIERARLQVDTAEPVKSFAQHKKYRRLMGQGMGIATLAMVALFAGLGIQTVFEGFTLPLWMVLSLSLLSCVPLCVVAIGAGQGGSRLKVHVEEKDLSLDMPLEQDSEEDDRFWVWGMFYYNPGDPACIVEGRFGSNIGFNYARTVVKTGMCIGMVALVALYIWMIVLFLPMI